MAETDFNTQSEKPPTDPKNKFDPNWEPALFLKLHVHFNNK